MAMNTPDSRLNQIALARRALVQGGAELTDALVGAWLDRAWIVRSWQRCLARGARPDRPVVFEPAPRRAGADAAEQHGELLALARPALQRLARQIAPVRYFALLTDARGTVIDTAGAIDHRDRATHAIARIGIDLSEQSIGTSAIGAALAERAPVWLHRGEHFFTDTGVYSCAGAPLFGPDGNCLGMIDVTGVDVPERPELQHLVAHTARQIEEALILARPHSLRLRLSWPEGWQVSGGGGAEGLLCLDADGQVVGANSSARQMLPALHTLAGAPLHAADLFALPWAGLFDAAVQDGPRTVPLWSGLRLQLRAERRQRAPLAAPRSLKALESALIDQAVRDAGGRVAEAARKLGVSRATVYRRLAAMRKGAPG
ncbi:GAF domain-containing protein [Comamonas sp. NLF-1-9]|nr:helix-turn-helix domain-containing protein [Comamonas sp. NLF-1-9]QXL83802.1 GAF domain-containing protein [Comamonas sp. NLF-1-9]